MLREEELKRAIIRGKPIEFKVVREEWNEYIIKDEKPVKLRGKLVTTKVIKTDQYTLIGEPIYAHGYQTIFVTFAPPELKGEPTLPPPSDLERLKLVQKELDFEAIKEVWNEYELEDGTKLRVRLVVTGVQRTSAYGTDGDPLYNINSSAIGHFIIPPTLRRK